VDGAEPKEFHKILGLLLSEAHLYSFAYLVEVSKDNYSSPFVVDLGQPPINILPLISELVVGYLFEFWFELRAGS